MSKNGKFLHELVNSGEKCKGTFTRINNKNCFEESVLDYAFCSPIFYKYVMSLCIDELKVQTPCGFLKKENRPSDHFAIIMEINIPKREHISAEKKKTVWNFQDKEGWEKFRSMTNADKNLTTI